MTASITDIFKPKATGISLATTMPIFAAAADGYTSRKNDLELGSNPAPGAFGS